MIEISDKLWLEKAVGAGKPYSWLPTTHNGNWRHQMIEFILNQTCLHCSIYFAKRNTFAASDSLHLVTLC